MEEPEEFSLQYFLNNNEDIFEYVSENNNPEKMGILFELQVDKKGNPDPISKFLQDVGFKVNCRQSKLLFLKFGYYIDAEKELKSASLEEVQTLTKKVYEIADENEGLLIDCLLSHQ